MADETYTAYSGFSRMILPQTLFNFSTQQDSLLLAQRYAKPFVQNVWREFCKLSDMRPDPAVDALDTQAKFLGGSLASVVIRLPPPQRVGEAHMALFIVPAPPDEGPRRYFTLDVAEGPTTGNPATALNEWVPSGGGADFQLVHHADGIEPNPEAFGAAVERVTVAAPTQTATSAEAKHASAAADESAGAGPPLFTRYLVLRGKAEVREAVAQTELKESGLKFCSSMLLGIRAGAAEVVRANPHTGVVQTVAFGIPGDLFPRLPPELDAVYRSRPDHLFTVSSDGKPLILNLLVPAATPNDPFGAAASLLVQISGEPDPAAGERTQQWRQTFQEIMDHRPALVSVFARWPGDADQLADVLGFTQHFGAAVFLERPEPAAAPAATTASAEQKQGRFSRWLGKLLGK